MKKLLAICLVVIMVLSLAACGKKEEVETETEAPKMSLEDRGLEAIQTLKKMAMDEDYVSSIASASLITDLIKDMGRCDYTNPSGIYKITFTDKAINNISDGLIDDLTEPEVKAQIERKATASIANVINSAFSSTFLAAGATISSTDSFCDDRVTENMTYVYVYKQDYSAAVTFMPGEDDSVMMTASFVNVIDDGEAKWLNLIKPLGVSVEKIK